MMDHALRTISYIADIGDLVVLMARRRMITQDGEDPTTKIAKTPKMVCHVFESEEVLETVVQFRHSLSDLPDHLLITICLTGFVLFISCFKFKPIICRMPQFSGAVGHGLLHLKSDSTKQKNWSFSEVIPDSQDQLDY